MRILLLIIFLLIVNCKMNKVVDNHGVHYLDKKQQNLIVNKSNKNDIILLLGPPSTKSKFDNDLWIYIERKKTRTTLFKLGKKKIYLNKGLSLGIKRENNLGIKSLVPYLHHHDYDHGHLLFYTSFSEKHQICIQN